MRAIYIQCGYEKCGTRARVLSSTRARLSSVVLNACTSVVLNSCAREREELKEAEDGQQKRMNIKKEW